MDELRPDSVGLRISRIVQERGLKPKDLERPSGLDRNSLAKLLRGDRNSTSLEAGLRIARFLQIDPYELLPARDATLPAAFDSGTVARWRGEVETTLEELHLEVVALRSQVQALASDLSAAKLKPPKRQSA